MSDTDRQFTTAIFALLRALVACCCRDYRSAIHPNPAMLVAKATVALPVLQDTKHIFINEGSSFFQAESVKLTTPYIFSFEIL